MRRAIFFILVMVMIAPLRAQEADPDETGRHLAAMRARLDDETIDLGTRADLALETAATLDRAARAEPKLDARLERWDAAVALLDDFSKKNDGLPRKRELNLQAGVYRWAEARAWHDQHALFPADARTRAGDECHQSVKAEGLP